MSAGGRYRSLVARAPAKVNLVLEVNGRRPDGYHELRSVLAPLALHDTLSVRARAVPPGAGVADTLAIDGAPDVPVEGNLVLRASALLRASAMAYAPAAPMGPTARAPGRARPAARLAPLAFHLRKRIPAAAGLGGGSSDALAALDLAAAAWGIRLSGRRRLELGAMLGSDVPFFAVGGWALVGGRGERLRRLPPPADGPLGVLLVVPAARLSTRDVFAAFDAAGGGEPGGPRGPRSRSQSGRDGTVAPGTLAPARRSAARLAALLRGGASAATIAAIEPVNDLLPAAIGVLAGLARLRDELAAELDRPVHLSGSGPSLVLLYPSPREAHAAAAVARDAAARGRLHAPGGTLDILPTATGDVTPTGDTAPTGGDS